MFHGLTHTALVDIIASTGPIELKGVTLLRQCAPDPFTPQGIDADTMAEAAVEIIDYTRACDAARRRLHDLRPVPLAAPVGEFCL